MNLRTILAAATCLAVPVLAMPVLAHAQPVTGPYVSLGGGTSILNPVNSNFERSPVGLGGKYQFRASYAGVGGVGFGFGDGFRVEISGNYIRNSAHAWDYSDNAGDSGHLRAYGGEEKYGAMADVYYDISVGLPIFPYVGAGAGYQLVKFDKDLSIDDGFGNRINTGGTKGSFAYNIIGGVSYPIPMVPGLSLTAEYRFMQLTSSRNYSSQESFGGTTVSTGRNKIGQESSHTFLAGIRYALYTPPPPAPAPEPAPAPVAAPAPAPAKTYLVFFDWDRYNLTPRATSIISQAAADSKTAQTTTINVSGYTDTSGTTRYNLGLSERRAKAVAAQLVADGVPASEIETHGYGETHLLVPTGPGVREPQNRRVEIVLQ